mgnify:CR=1 FL=1
MPQGQAKGRQLLTNPAREGRVAMREPIYAFATRARADRMHGGADADVADRERVARQQRMQVLPVPDEAFARPASKHHACAQPNPHSSITDVTERNNHHEHRCAFFERIGSSMRRNTLSAGHARLLPWLGGRRARQPCGVWQVVRRGADRLKIIPPGKAISPGRRGIAIMQPLRCRFSPSPRNV